MRKYGPNCVLGRWWNPGLGTDHGFATASQPMRRLRVYIGGIREHLKAILIWAAGILLASAIAWAFHRWIATQLTATFPVPGWAIVGGVVAVAVVSVSAVLWFKRHPRLPTDTPYELYGLRFFLTPPFFREYRTTQAATTNSSHLASLVTGPFCLHCHFDRALQIQEPECANCGRSFGLPQVQTDECEYEDEDASRHALLNAMKSNVYQHAQADALKGVLKPRLARA